MQRAHRVVSTSVLLLALALAAVGQPLLAQAPVFINEIHYDNVGADVGEAIEIAGPAGTDLAGWSLVLYNGSSGASYNTIPLTGFLPDEGSGYGTLSFAISGIQNGSPDGMALVDVLGAVVQFLSYEGIFVATNGPANGQTSVDIGVAEASSAPVGTSLQLAGTGTIAGDFTWSGSSTASFGFVNAGQTFVLAAIELVVNEIMQNPDAVFDSAGEWFELFNPNASAVDIDGWSFEDLGTNSHTITNGGPLLIPAGGYLVLGNNADPLTNGGVSVDYQYSGFTLANGDDEVILLDTLGFESDRVEYDGGPSFPDPTGASMALNDPALDNNVGANWCTSSTVFGVGDLGTPGAANDCGVPPVPVLVIHEIIQNPAAVADAAGEWFEIFNPTAAPVDIDGFTIADNDSDSHVISNGGPLVIAAGGYLVLGINGDTITNGGVSVDYVYSGITLANGADEVVLFDTLLREVDRVEYDGGPGFPDPTGAAMALVAPALDNNVGANWCTASTPYGAGDLGTPGAANDCVVAIPELVINEIIQNPAAVSDTNGEWLELFNPTADPIDIDGFTLRDDGTDSHVINNGGPLVIAPGGFLVLARDANFATNGGVVVDYQYSSFFLGNGGDEVILVDTSLNEVDRVEYDGGPGFPDPTGASMALANPGLDNNLGASWCTSSTPFGGGDLGTPGAANDCPPPVLVINEVDYDQVGSDTGEFIEIANVGGSPAVLGDFTLELVNGSGGAVYETIALPAAALSAGGYFVVCGNAANVANCDLDVSPDANLIQNGAPDAVVLRDAGGIVDALSYEGSVPGAVEGTGTTVGDSNSEAFKSLARLPDGTDTDMNDADFAFVCITPGGGNLPVTMGCTADGPVLEIFDIQGNGAFSPFAGFTVMTRDNVVTGVATNGFFMQTPTARTDSDVATSDGIFVFTGGAPGVAEGDLVDVSGTVTEFFDFTEFDNDGLMVSVTSPGNPLPAEVLLDALNPDPGPFDPPDMERFEGMLVELVDGIATGPTDGFGDTAVTVGPDRTFREPGVEFPNPFAGVPEWDGNQEVFEVDPDGLAGMPDADIFAYQSVTASGPLTYSFGDYQILPRALTLGPEPVTLRSVREREAGELTVGTLNLFRLNGGFGKLSAYIVGVLRSPDILAVQEVFDIVELEALADQIALDDPSVVYTASLIEGSDPGGIDVGFLTRESIQVDAVTQLAAAETFVDPTDGSIDILHDRPPLLLEASYVCDCDTGFDPTDDDSDSDSDSDSDGGGPGCVDAPGVSLKVLAVHSRSLSGIEDPFDGPRVRQKRLEQAESIARISQDLQDADPDVRLVVLGDFNAFEFNDGLVDATGHMKGDFDDMQSVVCQTNTCADLVDPDLTNQVFAVPATDRYSFVFGGNAQVLDHILTSQALAGLVRGVEYGRGNADAPSSLIGDPSTALRASDHDGMVLFLSTECPRELKIGAIDALMALLPTGSSQADARIAKAIGSLVDSLDSSFWIDGRHVSSKKVFDGEKKALEELEKAIDQGNLAPETEDAIREVIDSLLRADRILATVAIEEAIAAVDAAGCFVVDPDDDCEEAIEELAKAADELVGAEADIAAGEPEKAVNHLKKAWERALEAIEELED